MAVKFLKKDGPLPWELPPGQQKVSQALLEWNTPKRKGSTLMLVRPVTGRSYLVVKITNDGRVKLKNEAGHEFFARFGPVEDERYVPHWR